MLQPHCHFPAPILFGLLLLLGLPGPRSSSADDWSQWRGPDRAGSNPETKLLPEWPSAGPALTWSNTNVGIGFAGPAIVQDRVYLLGDLDDGCYLLCLEAGDGRLAWKLRLADSGGNKTYPGPRATPSLQEDELYAMTQHGEVTCVQLSDRRIRWQRNLVKEFAAVCPMWHFGEAPLVDHAAVVCTPGGPEGTLLALDRRDGKPLWRTATLTNPAAYSSPVVAEISGVRQYIQLTAQNVFGVDAKSGAVLWNAPWPGVRAVVPTVLVSADMVYVTSGYGVGCGAFRIERDGTAFRAVQVYLNKTIVNHHGGVVKHGDYLYGYSDTGGWTCQDFKTGRSLWQAKGVGKGSVTYADGHLYCRSEDGPIALVEATPKAYQEQGQFAQPYRSKKKAWPHPVISGGRLYVRDQGVLLCYGLRSR